jgi:hypothetical protein
MKTGRSNEGSTWAARSCPDGEEVAEGTERTKTTEGTERKASPTVEEWLSEVTPEVEVAAGTRERKPEVKVAVMGKDVNLAEMALEGYWLCKGCRHVEKKAEGERLKAEWEDGNGATCERCKGVMEWVPGIFFGAEGAS